jgi:hypothetical protein
VQTARQTIRQKSQVPDQLVGLLGGVREGGQVTAGDLVGAGGFPQPRELTARRGDLRAAVARSDQRKLGTR